MFTTDKLGTIYSLALFTLLLRSLHTTLTDADCQIFCIFRFDFVSHRFCQFCAVKVKHKHNCSQCDCGATCRTAAARMFDARCSMFDANRHCKCVLLACLFLCAR